MRPRSEMTPQLEYSDADNRLVPQKSPLQSFDRNQPLSNPKPALEPRRPEPLNLPLSGQMAAPGNAAVL